MPRFPIGNNDFFALQLVGFGKILQIITDLSLENFKTKLWEKNNLCLFCKFEVL